MRLLILTLVFPFFVLAQKNDSDLLKKYKEQAKRVTIIRDTWGIPHIYGKTDADAVFGLLYTECEENFPRVEKNYLEMMGRSAEIEGKKTIYDDLEMRLIYDSSAAKRDYKISPAWFKKLLQAFADGINYYLVTHPYVKPLVLKRFEPWFPLMYTDGSIAPTQDGGLTMKDLLSLYAKDSNALSYKKPVPFFDVDPSGSNGFAVAPVKTANKNSILYINPHVSFYFRTEVHMVSEEGLNVYGAVTWGQFFVYQGFNQHCGWMHTSSYADVADLYEEKIVKKTNGLFYLYDGKSYPVKTKKVTINYKGVPASQNTSFTIYATLHGPVMGMRNGKWLSLKENNRSLKSLMQSWLRTKANGFQEFKKVMDLRANNSNNTVFADDKGNIAYWHGNFMPKRDPSFNWNLPVDGTTSETNWKGIHTLDEVIHVYNPPTGWIQNCNSTPFTVSGSSSPKKENYPSYMAPDGQNPRAINAIKLLSEAHDLTIDKMIHDIGYNHYLSAFDILLPSLFQGFDNMSKNDSTKDRLTEVVNLLKSWDRNSASASVATTVAIEWAYKLAAYITPPAAGQASNLVGQLDQMASLSFDLKLKLLSETLQVLQAKFGSWKTSWGEVNRYQRIGANEKFNDQEKSFPVGLAAAKWGSIPSYVSAYYPNTNKRYGVSGNSFIACVEFGKRLKAKTIITGGQSFDPRSNHYTDQAKGYINGDFKDVWFYKEDVLKHIEKTYHPGDEH